MADKKISDLSSSGALGGTEELPIVQSGSTVKTTISAIKTYFDTIYATISGYVKKGTLTANYIPKATASDTIGDSSILDDGTSVVIGDGSTYRRLNVLNQGSRIIVGTNLEPDAYNIYVKSDDNAINYPIGLKDKNNLNLLTTDANGRTALGKEQNYAIPWDSILQILGGDTDRLLSIKNNITDSDIFLVKGDGTINAGGLTVSKIVETDASRNLVSSSYAVSDLEKTANKDATGGYVGLTLFKINFKNVANTFTSFFTNSNTAARTYTFQDRNGTIADDTDLALKAPIASPTFTGTATTPAIVVSSETASRVAIIDASKNVKSADTATYPSLTELSYAKGVTSAIQTQLDAKLTASNNLSDLSNPFTARNNLKEWDLIITTGNQTTTSNVAANITDLVSPTLTINKRYKISGILHIGCNNTGGVKIQATLPTGATMWLSLLGQDNSNTSITRTAITTSSSLSAVSFSNFSSANSFVFVDGEVLLGGTSGTIQFGFASGTNTQTSTVYQLGTHIKLTQLD